MTSGTTPGTTPARPHRPWPGAAIVAVVAGSLLAVAALGTAVTATGAAWLNANRDAGGYISTHAQPVTTSAYALTVEDVRISTFASGFLNDALGDVRIQVTGSDKPLFAGIAPQRDAIPYLRNLAYDQITQMSFAPDGVTPGDPADIRYSRHPGTAPELAPATQPLWTSQVNGTGTQTLTWNADPGRWALIVMNAGGSPGVTADLSVAAAAPGLGGLVAILYGTAFVLLLLGAGLVGLALSMAGGGGGTVNTPRPAPRIPGPHTPGGVPA
jgi:hypothetical protein